MPLVNMPLPGRGVLCAIDFGSKFDGLAFCDEMQMIAVPSVVIPFQANNEDLIRIILEKRACGLLIGWPITLQGTEGEQCEFVKRRILSLGLDLPYQLWDERFSSRVMSMSFRGSGGRRQTRRQPVRNDAHSAAIILQVFLDSKSLRG